MRHRALFASFIGVVVISSAVAYVWFRGDDASRSAEVAGPSSEGPTPLAEGEIGGSVISAPVEGQLAEPLEDRPELQRDLGDRLYAAHSDPKFVDYFVNRGLSREDSERVIAEAFRGAAECWLMAGRAKAIAERAAFDAAREAERGPSPTDTTYGPCIVSALQQAGLPLRQGPGFAPRPLK